MDNAISPPECETIITIYKNDFRYCGYAISDLAEIDFADFPALTGGAQVFPGKLIFLDTETTGLSGGAGTVAFLIGVGYFIEGGFIVKQYLIRDYDEEESQLSNLAAEMGGRDALVTYNGKAFDMNLLSSRYIMNGMRLPRSSCHIDLLHPERRVWRRCVENCRLSTIENVILGERRADDIPGSLIPQVFFDFLETHEYETMQKVLSHNRMDILALAAILKYITDLAARARRGEPYSMSWHGIAGKMSSGRLADRVAEELLGLGGFCNKNDDNALAETCYLASLEREKPAVIRRSLASLAEMKKREGKHDQAAAYWLSLIKTAPTAGIYPYVEVAKYLEHKKRDPASAMLYTQLALALASGPVYRDSRIKLELAARLERLNRKANKITASKTL